MIEGLTPPPMICDPGDLGRSIGDCEHNVALQDLTPTPTVITAPTGNSGARTVSRLVVWIRFHSLCHLASVARLVASTRQDAGNGNILVHRVPVNSSWA